MLTDVSVIGLQDFLFWPCGFRFEADFCLFSQNFGGGMRPPHNTMGPGMPGVNMWASCLLSEMYFKSSATFYQDFHLRSYVGAQERVGHGPIPTMPTLWVEMQAHKFTHKPREMLILCNQISSLSCRGLQGSTAGWDVIVVLCIMVSTDSWTDSHNGIRTIKWWMMTVWGTERVCAPISGL